MANDIDRRIKILNRQLKGMRNPLRIIRRDNWLYGRATLPPKPHLSAEYDKPYQQKFSTKLRADSVGVEQAYRLMVRLGPSVQLGEFDWKPWIRPSILAAGQRNETAKYWIEKFEERFWIKHKRHPASEHNWKSYRGALSRIEPNAPLSYELLINAIATTNPDTRTRKHAVGVYSKLCQIAGLDPAPIQEFRGRYSIKLVEPRELPDDELIESVVDGLYEKGNGWAWVVAMIATYGLRNHEVFHLDLAEFPNIFVGPHTKTGRRYVYPPRLQWGDRWDLNQIDLPPIREIQKPDPQSWDNCRLGDKVGRAFSRLNLPFRAYDLRHSFGRRCFDHGYPPDLAAKVMGHSLQIHTQIYRAWWGEETYRRAYDRLMLEKLV